MRTTDAPECSFNQHLEQNSAWNRTLSEEVAKPISWREGLPHCTEIEYISYLVQSANWYNKHVKITVLDAAPALEGLDLHTLSALGELDLYQMTSPNQLTERLADAEIIVLNKVPLTAETLTLAPKLKLVTVLATGHDVVDGAAARAAGVTLCNVAGYSTASTAQHAIALLLELTNQVGQHAASVAAGEWQARGIWSWADTPLMELDGKTLALVGYGAIGGRVGKIAEALGLRVLPVTRTPREGTYPLNEALAQADIVVLQCPLTPATRGLINAETLAMLKPGALLVNCARGPVIDEAAVAAALHSGHLAGFATDVLSTEPPAPDNPLLSAPNTRITPHHAWATKAARERLLAETVANIAAFQAGSPRNVVNG
jgi:glycerate dehydrogenase